jgi:hypothetical protein
METEQRGEWYAFTVRQPWAELIISGRKSIEIRSWVTDYRGRLWLHTGLKHDAALEREFGFRDLYRGGFIGSVELVAVVHITPERWVQWASRHLSTEAYSPGLVAWLLESPHRFRAPVAARGELRLFRPNDDLLRQLDASERAVIDD